MASSGDEVTYTFSGAKETEDVSAVDTLFIRRMDGASGYNSGDPDSPGGQIKLARADVSALSKIEVFVGESGQVHTEDGSRTFGRSRGGGTTGGDAGSGGGSTEVIEADGTLIAAADSGGGGGDEYFPGGGGARGGSAGEFGLDAQGGEGSGFGGDGGDLNKNGEDGGQELGTATIQADGSMTKGGGAGSEEEAEVVLAFDKPRTPTNLSLSEDLATVGPTVDISWTNPGPDRENRVYRASGSTATFPDDFGEIATVPAGTEAFSDSPSYESTITYVVTATLNGGESDPSAPASITTSSAGELVVTLTGTNSPVTTGDTLELDVDVENIGDYRADEDIDAVLEPQ